MTSQEVIDFFTPHQDSVEAVIGWLVESGISRDRIGQSANKQVCNTHHYIRTFRD